MRFFVSLGVATFVLASWMVCAAAEQGPPSPQPPDAQPASAAGLETVHFEQVFTQWKEVLTELRKLRLDYKNAQPMQRGEIRRRYNELMEQAEAESRQVLDAAEKAYAATPGDDPRLVELLFSLSVLDLQRENYEEALRLARILIDHDTPAKGIYGVAAIAAFNAGQFEAAERYYEVAKEVKALDDDTERMFRDLEYYKEVWPKEEKLRAAEAQANDLPRVLLKTNKGDIEVELFENEAPNAAANFISLVEKGFFNGLEFPRVVPKSFAQGGCPANDPSGGPGYSIACECYQPNHRLNFRGSLTMAHRGRDTGGSQFFLMFVPLRRYDGKNTVFGRVVKGMEVLSKLERRDPTSKEEQPDADRIVEAKVLRKRNHPYEPKKLVEE